MLHFSNIPTKFNYSSLFTTQENYTHNTRNSKKNLDIPYHRLTNTAKLLQLKQKYSLLRLISFSDCNFKRKLLNWLTLNPFYSIHEFVNAEVDLPF